MNVANQRIEKKEQWNYILKSIVIMIVLFAISSTLLIFLIKHPLTIDQEWFPNLLRETLFWCPISYLSLFIVRAVEIRKKALCFPVGVAIFLFYVVLGYKFSFLRDLIYSDIVQVIGFIIGTSLGFVVFCLSCKMHFDFTLVQAFVLTYMGLIVLSLCMADSQNRVSFAIAGSSLIISSLSFMISSSQTKRQVHIMRLQHYEQNFYECRKSVQGVVDSNLFLMAEASNAVIRKKCGKRLRGKVEKELLSPIAQHLLFLNIFGTRERKENSFMFEEDNQLEFWNLFEKEESFFQQSFAATIDERIVDVVSFFVKEPITLSDSEIKVLRAYFQKASTEITGEK